MDELDQALGDYKWLGRWGAWNWTWIAVGLLPAFFVLSLHISGPGPGRLHAARQVGDMFCCIVHRGYGMRVGAAAGRRGESSGTRMGAEPARGPLRRLALTPPGALPRLAIPRGRYVVLFGINEQHNEVGIPLGVSI